jgi:hypothetical protein
MTILLRRTMAGHLRSSRSRKIHNVFQRIRSDFSGPAAAHLPASLSPRDEWQCQTGSWPA